MWALTSWNSSKFFCQYFPDAHSSKFSPVKILCHTVSKGSTEIQRLPEEGDVVLVKDDNLPRVSWKLVHLSGKDGKV